MKREEEYHQSIQSYKNTSWFSFSTKLRKRKEVRYKKRLTQQSNHSLRSPNEVRHFYHSILIQLQISLVFVESLTKLGYWRCRELGGRNSKLASLSLYGKFQG
jgi:hypothetical protein